MIINKLNKTFKINPLAEADGYKLAHKRMLAKRTTRLAGNWIPRSLKYMHPSITKIMSAQQQVVVRYLHSHFQENFFSRPKEEVVDKFVKDASKYLNFEYDGQHFSDLYDLGFLPIEIQALPEGLFTNPNIPHMTFINTVDGYAWLTLYLETMISKLAWQGPTVATIGHKFKENAIKAVLETDEDNLWLADYMCHDFHSRGGNPFTSIIAGLGFAMSNSGGDTLNTIEASRYYYDFDENEVPIFSVNASEHSVSTTKIFTVGEKQMIIDWLKEFPTGILSIVADTFDLWKLITEYLQDPEVKKLIMARDGKLVIRPDSGDPVDIICGNYNNSVNKRLGIAPLAPENKGVIELLWDTFGGTVNKQGYKVLDSHIGAIYGDSINLERQVQIYSRLKDKQFAATNIVVGVGSYSLVYMTRDQAGYAAKGCWFEILNEDGTKMDYAIYKDPITDDGTKKSLKGFSLVKYDDNNEIVCISEVTENIAYSEENLLRTIYKNGEFSNQTTLTEIRERIKNK